MIAITLNCQLIGNWLSCSATYQKFKKKWQTLWNFRICNVNMQPICRWKSFTLKLDNKWKVVFQALKFTENISIVPTTQPASVSNSTWSLTLHFPHIWNTVFRHPALVSVRRQPAGSLSLQAPRVTLGLVRWWQPDILLVLVLTHSLKTLIH